MKIDIITCPQWGARKPKAPPVVIPKSHEIIFHHTASHLRQIDRPADESREEAIQYAQAIQRFHMDVRGWNDSGHNFLVTRGGHILQGRWYTVTAIEAGQMVVSAHTLGDKGRPSRNDQIGIEHEHVTGESMTSKQWWASAQLQAWIALQYDRKVALPVSPHSKYTSTACPDVLAKEIVGIRVRAQELITAENT